MYCYSVDKYLRRVNSCRIMPKFRDRCCNMFLLEHHRASKNLRTIPKHHFNRLKLVPGDRLCSSCYKKMLGENSSKHGTETIDERKNPDDGENSNVDFKTDNEFLIKDENGNISVDHSDDNIDILTGRYPIGNIYLMNSLDIIRYRDLSSSGTALFKHFFLYKLRFSV